ncbi:hypothetical protein GBF38_005573 [Nibea albiflora]|uniref:Uncharacterized protein n=1 Tax=Nibea albiflora TaxID=240163 RepID=A0ACB7EWK4_NIBAL|nr:hypothetical protein GBF38_005573 [Nibea albiflora]
MTFRSPLRTLALLASLVIQGNKPPPHQVTFFVKDKSLQADDSGKRIEVLLISSGPLTPSALLTHADSVSVCKATLPAAWIAASETGIEREEGWASARHQEAAVAADAMETWEASDLDSLNTRLPRSSCTRRGGGAGGVMCGDYRKRGEGVGRRDGGDNMWEGIRDTEASASQCPLEKESEGDGWNRGNMDAVDCCYVTVHCAPDEDNCVNCSMNQPHRPLSLWSAEMKSTFTV